jgi:nucleotide-binding universal stress UspA family protein
MRVLVWIVEETWRAPVTAAAAFLRSAADVTILHVRESDVETVASAARRALLGRPRRTTDTSLDAISEECARELLEAAQAVLGREAALEGRSGRIEREVVAAAETMDLLVFARDGERSHLGPGSLGPTARYVVDHAPCAVLLAWPEAHSNERSKE